MFDIILKNVIILPYTKAQVVWCLSHCLSLIWKAVLNFWFKLIVLTDDWCGSWEIAPSECDRIVLMISQYLSRQRRALVRQQATRWTNVTHWYRVSLGNNGLNCTYRSNMYLPNHNLVIKLCSTHGVSSNWVKHNRDDNPKLLSWIQSRANFTP